jgi:tryptophan 2,3-dioxygenase
MRATRTEIDRLFHELQAAKELLDQRELPEARKALARVKRAAKRLGVTSNYLRWCLSSLYQAQRNPARALATIGEAVLADPLHPALGDRFGEAARGVRTELEERSRDPADEGAPRLYAQLLEVGEADWTSHVAAARHHLGTGKVAEAGRVLRALTLLDPTQAEAWRLLAEVARRSDAPAGEAEALEAQAAAVAAAATPYGVPSPGVAC